MRGLVLLLSLLGLVLSQCPQSSDPCSVVACPCGGFTTVKIQTDPVTAVTLVTVNVTNYCAQGVYYVNFGLTDGTNTITPFNVPNPYSSQYQWATSTVTTSNPTRTWLQFATQGGGTNNNMESGSGASQWDLFTFQVKNYVPVFGWYFQIHYGASWDTYGPLDMSLCQCTNCDAGFSQRTIQPCVVGYADANGVYSGPTNRASSIFNENQVLYTYAIYNNYLALFYSDEFPMCLGVQTIINNVDSPPQSNTYPFTNGTQLPTCIYGNAILFGSTSYDGLDPWSAIDVNSGVNGCNELSPPVVGTTCGRPMSPVMFISDITTDSTNKTGDWQFYGPPFLPHKVCGLWQSSTKTISAQNADGTYNFTVVPVTRSLPPSNQNPVGSGAPFWNLGAGSDPPPIGFVNPSAVGTVPYLNTFGAEVAWDLDNLPLQSSHSYRFQFLVHDGDATKVGGDVGQACLITNQACPAGFFGTNCDQCDTNPVPADGSWTWFCSITGSQPPYNLLKLPTSKISQPPYAGNGFVPSLNYNDSQGYIVGCNCVRVVYTCPQACCGNGVCKDNIGVCSCTNMPPGTNTTTCCLPPPPPPVPPPISPPTCEKNLTAAQGINCTTCISNTFNLACSWCPTTGVSLYSNDSLVNGTCKTQSTCPNTELRTCQVLPPPPPPPTCTANLTVAQGTNCSTCISNVYGIACAWCPGSNIPLWQGQALVNGTCQDQNTCPQNELRQCTLAPPPPPPVPPPVPPPTAVPVYQPVCSDMTTPAFGGNQTCSACVSNSYQLQCAWCPANITAQPPNRTLTEGSCSPVNGCGGGPEFYTCVAPVPPPPPPPPPTCQNVSQIPGVNCSTCIANIYSLQCSWCPSSNSTANLTDYLTVGNCQVPSTCQGVEELTCIVPPPPPPPPVCTDLSPPNGSNCSTCITNVFNLQCAWCPSANVSTQDNASLVQGTCQAYTTCPAAEYYTCELPPPPPVPPCYNDGNYCSGNGNCTNGTCNCLTDPAGLSYEGAACNITVYPPPLSCANLTGVYNCSDCLAKASILGLQCAWCPNTTDPLRQLSSGVCIEDYICGNASFYACTPPSVFVPPECADNCSNHGLCVNISRCHQIQAMDQGAYVINTVDADGNAVQKIYTCDPANLNQTLANNQTSLCACLDPFTGINCGVVGAGINLIIAAGIAAGIIAAIVVLGILGLVLFGGGAYAATSALAAAPNAAVDMNPLYVPNETSSDNPLYA